MVYWQLELSEQLRNENIVDEFTFDRQNYFKVKLDHKDQQKLVPFEFDWTKTYQNNLESFEKRLERKGVNKKHANMILDTVDNNHQAILQFLTQSQLQFKSKSRSSYYDYNNGNSSATFDATRTKLKPLHEHTVYKYSNRGKGNLHEAIILAGKPAFIQYDDSSGQIRVVEGIQEDNHDKLKWVGVSLSPALSKKINNINGIHTQTATWYDEIPHKDSPYAGFVLNWPNYDSDGKCYSCFLPYNLKKFMLILLGIHKKNTIIHSNFIECPGYTDNS